MSPNISAHILIVDDQDNWRKLLKKALNDENIHISEASTIQDAQSLLSQTTFDLVVFDVRLEDAESYNVEGLALLHFVKTHSPKTKTIVLTGYPESVRGIPDADEFMFKVPPGKTFDRRAFKNKVTDFICFAVNR